MTYYGTLPEDTDLSFFHNVFVKVMNQFPSRVQLDLELGVPKGNGWPACHLNISSKYLISYPRVRA